MAENPNKRAEDALTEYAIQIVERSSAKLAERLQGGGLINEHTDSVLKNSAATLRAKATEMREKSGLQKKPADAA